MAKAARERLAREQQNIERQWHENMRIAEEYARKRREKRAREKRN